MDPNQGEEAAPLVVVVEDGGPAAVRPSKNHARDAHILSFSFFFIFCAYSAAQNLESTVNTVSPFLSSLNSGNLIAWGLHDAFSLIFF